jgi:hypothetical protein
VRKFAADGLTVFEKRMLRRVFRPKGDEMTGGSEKLHNEELHNLKSYPCNRPWGPIWV